MKIKTSVTLSQEVLEQIDRQMSDFKSRSEFLEVAAHYYLRQCARKDRDQRDREIIDRQAGHLNKEAGDVLDFQVPT